MVTVYTKTLDKIRYPENVDNNAPEISNETVHVDFDKIVGAEEMLCMSFNAMSREEIEKIRINDISGREWYREHLQDDFNTPSPHTFRGITNINLRLKMLFQELDKMGFKIEDESASSYKIIDKD